MRMQLDRNERGFYGPGSMARVLSESVLRSHDFHGSDRPYLGAMDRKVKSATCYWVRHPPCDSITTRMGGRKASHQLQL